MITRDSKSFQCSSDNLSSLIKELKDRNIDYKKGSDTIQFEIQMSNVVTTVTIYDRDHMAIEEQLFMINVYPFVSSFLDVVKRCK